MRFPMGWKQVALWAVPGLCQIHHERAGRGLVWFLIFALCLNGYLIAPFLSTSNALRIGALAAAATCWALAAYDASRCTTKSRTSK